MGTVHNALGLKRRVLGSSIKPPWALQEKKHMNKLGKHLVHLPSFKRSTTSCGKFLKRWEYQIILPASWETCKKVKKQELEWDMELQTGSKLGKEYTKAVYCHPAYLTSMQCTYIMWNARLDKGQAGIKIAGRNINNNRYVDDTTLIAES